MCKRGPKPKGKVRIEWSANFAYAIGLIASDGCLYSHGHIAFVSKDLDQIKNFMSCLGINVKIGITNSGHKKTEAYRVQFGDIIFYDFLQSIGITPVKSKTIAGILVPEEYFFDFLRGLFDGDGSFYSYWDKRWRSSHMFYIEFISASKQHIDWLRSNILEKVYLSGHIGCDSKKTTYQLKYAKREALEIIKRMYYNRDVVCLNRKRRKIESALGVEQNNKNLSIDKIMPRW